MHIAELCSGPCVRGGGGGLVERRGRLYQPSSLGSLTVPTAEAAGTRGRGLARDGAWHWGVRAPYIVGILPLGHCLGPVARGFAPGTQPGGRAGEY